MAPETKTGLAGQSAGAQALNENRAMSGPRAAVGVLLLFGAVSLALYLGSLNGPMVLDDDRHLVTNPHLANPEFSLAWLSDAALQGPSKSRILPKGTFAVQVLLHGHSPALFRLFNILVHALAAWMVYLLASLLLTSPWAKKQGISPGLIPFFTGLIWLAHPLGVQSVAYVIQRMNQMGALFFLACLVCWCQGRMATGKPAQKAWLLGAALCMVLAFLSKENTLVLPAMVFLVEWYFFQDLSPAWLRRTAPWMLGLLAALAVLALWYMKFNPLLMLTGPYKVRDFTMEQRVLTQLRVVPFYLGLLLLPWPGFLNLEHDFPLSNGLTDPITTALGLVFLLALFSVAVFRAKKARLFSFCTLWFLGALFMESSFLGLEIIFQHRTYLPMVGPILWVTSLVLLRVRPSRLAVGLLVAACLLFSAVTIQRNSLWSDPVRLWADFSEKSPNKARPRRMLAHSLYEAGQVGESYVHAQKAVELDPDNANAWFHLGRAQENPAINRPQEAIQSYKKAIDAGAMDVRPYYYLGAALARQGDTSRAMFYLNQALSVDPDNPSVLANLGKVELARGNLSAAVAHLERALALYPSLGAAHQLLGDIHSRLNNPEKAAAHFYQAARLLPGKAPALKAAGDEIRRTQQLLMKQIPKLQQALEKNPDNPAMAITLGAMLLDSGQKEQARAQLEKARTIAPDEPALYNNLGLVYMGGQDYDQARVQFEKALSLSPQDIPAAYNMVCLFSRQNQREEARAAFERLTGLGFSDMRVLEGDPDLTNLRRTDHYKQWLQDRRP